MRTWLAGIRGHNWHIDGNNLRYSGGKGIAALPPGLLGSPLPGPNVNPAMASSLRHLSAAVPEAVSVQPRESEGYNGLSLYGKSHGRDAVGTLGARPVPSLLTIGTVARTRSSVPIRLLYLFSYGPPLTEDTDARIQTQSVGSFLRPIATRCHWCLWRSQYRDTSSGSDGAQGGILFEFLFNLPHLCAF